MKTVSRSAIPVWLLSVAILISGVHLNVAQAKDSPKKNRATVAIACGNELTNQCNGVPVHGNNMLECIQKRIKQNCPRDVLHWQTILCAAVKGTQYNVANRLSRVAAIFSGA